MRPALGISLQPLPLPSLPIQSQLRKLHKLNAMEPASIRKAATLIGNWELTQTTFDAALEQFQRLLQSLHHFAISERNWWMLGICKTVSLALAHYLAGKLPLNAANLTRLVAMASQPQGRQGVEHFGNFYQEVLDGLCAVYRIRLDTVCTLQPLASTDLSWFDDFSQPDEVGDAVQQLLVGISTLQRYGVKSCIMRDGLMHEPAFAWVMYDGADFTSALVPEGAQLAQFDPPLAVTMLAQHEAVRTLKPTYDKEKVGVTPFKRVCFGFKSYTSANLYADGRVALDLMWGMLPLRDIFTEAKVGELYDQFHLLQLLRIYDLVTSVETTQPHATPNWPTYRRRHPGPVSAELTWRQLVVPRLRSLRDLDRVVAEVQREIAEDQAFTTQYGAGAAESREIQGFLRRLRKGRHATDRARQLAWNERRWAEIPAGYTYVKNHTWGSGPNRTAGHEAVRRSRS